jgi:hypothetical protein
VDEFTVYGRIETGEVLVDQRAYQQECLRTWRDGTIVAVTYRRQRNKLSALQRGYWFGLLVPMVAQETGDDEESVHEALKRLLLPKVTRSWRNRKTGKRRRLTVQLSLGDLDTKQMTDLIDRARLWAAEFLHLEIPEPDKAWRRHRRERAEAERKAAAA